MAQGKRHSVEVADGAGSNPAEGTRIGVRTPATRGLAGSLRDVCRIALLAQFGRGGRFKFGRFPVRIRERAQPRFSAGRAEAVLRVPASPPRESGEKSWTGQSVRGVSRHELARVAGVPRSGLLWGWRSPSPKNATGVRWRSTTGPVKPARKHRGFDTLRSYGSLAQPGRAPSF